MNADVERMAALYGEPERVETLRVPPQSAESERAVIGAVMIDETALPKVGDWLAADDFYRRDHRLIWRAIEALAEKRQPVDALTLGEWLEASGESQEMGGTSALIDIAKHTYTAANIEAHAEIVVEHSRRRKLIELGTGLVNDGFDRNGTAGELAGRLQSDLAALSPVRHTGLLPSKPGLLRWFEEVRQRCNRPGLIGLPTPWKGLNDATHGLRPGRLYVLAGRPGSGKSILGGNLAAFTALRGDRTALFSLEMSAEEIHQRNVSAQSEVPHDFLESPDEESDLWSKLHGPIDDLKKAPLLIDDSPALTAAQLCARAERAHMQAGLKLVVVDHLHEMTVDPRDRVNSLGDAARKLKGLAKRLNVPVVLLAQLNRASAADARRPTLTDLRASGAIEEVADAILLLHREDYYRPDTHLKGVVELAIAKGRNMRSGVTVHLLNRYDIMRADDWTGPLPEAPPPPAPEPKQKGFDPRARAAGSDR